MTDTSYVADKQILKKKPAVSSTESVNTLHKNYSARSATLYLLPRKDI